MRKIDYLSDSRKGIQRDENRDAVSIVKSDHYVLVLVFDGVSSYENSLKGIKKVVTYFERNHQAYYGNNTYDLAGALTEMHEMLKNSEETGMYTTVAALYIPYEGPAKYSHVGDTRIYYGRTSLPRERAHTILTLLTVDDNVAQAPNILTRCLGMQTLKENDIYEKVIKIQSTSAFILCTDGFYGCLDKEPGFYVDMLLRKGKEYAHDFIVRDIFTINPDDASYVVVLVHEPH